MKNGMAVLEEFLKQKYVENYESFNDDENKVVQLQNLYPEYFYIPSNSGIGNLRYVVDSEGHALYLIKKSGLPDEIKNQLTGGEAGEKTYNDYQRLNDVYGVTSDLKVYYSDGTDSLIGISSEDLDNDNPLRNVFQNNSEFYEILSSFDTDSDGLITAEELKSVDEIKLTSSMQISNLKELYNCTSLKSIVFDNINLESLEGINLISGLKEITFKNYANSNNKISDYSAIKQVPKLNKLIVEDSNDDILNGLINSMEGVNYTNLEYLYVYGTSSGKSLVSSLEILRKLSDITKRAAKYLDFSNNKLTTLTGIEDFINVVNIYGSGNSNLTSLAPLKKYSLLQIISFYNCNLGKDETYNETDENYGRKETDALSALEGKNISNISLNGNKNLKHIYYLKASKNASAINLASCTNLITEEVVDIKDTLNSSMQLNIDAKYSLALLDDSASQLTLTNYTISKSSFLGLKNKINITHLSLANLKFSEADIDVNLLINEVLETMTGIRYLSVRGISDLSDISFVKNMDNLVEIDLRDTSVTTIQDTESEEENDEDEVLENDSEEKITSLELLNSYCPLIGVIAINRDDTDLSKMQKCLEKLYASNVTSYFASWTGRGLLCSSAICLKTLENCKDIKNLKIRWNTSIDFGGIELDLSNTQIENFSSRCLNGVTINFPKTIKDIVMYASNKLPKVTAGSSITKFEISPTTNVSNYSFSKEEILNFFENLGKCSIGTLNLNSFGTLDTLTYLSSLNSCGITTLYLPDYTKNPSQTYSKIKSLSGIENLITLQYLYCQNNSITSLKELSNLTSLKYLDLSNNLIYDTSSYVDEKGETVTYNNLEILAKLNKYNKGKLEQLYLEGNSSIISFSPIQSLTWVAKSGF